MASTILEMRDITKTFPGVKALSNVNLSVEEGEIHAVVGENGAGKSTLMKVLSGVYATGTYDGLSRGITASLRAVGYGTDAQPWPIVTGQDAETASVKLIITGEQYSTVFKDTRELAKATVELVDKVLSGGKPDGLDEKTYNNDVKVVPSILLTPHDVDKSNYQALVVDSGYIKAEDLK